MVDFSQLEHSLFESISCNQVHLAHGSTHPDGRKGDENGIVVKEVQHRHSTYFHVELLFLQTEDVTAWFLYLKEPIQAVLVEVVGF